MSISDFWGLFSYLAALILGVFLVAKKIIRRPHFALRAAVCVAVIFLYKIGYDEMLRRLTIAESSKLVLRTIDSFNLYTLTMLSVGFCFECDIWAMLFLSLIHI